MAKLKVKMLVNTAYKGPRHEGEVISVPEDFAKRWAKNKIAVILDDAQEPEQVVEEPVAEEVEAIDYSSMSAKELYAACKEKGLEVEAKQSKEYYLEKLA